MQNKVAAVIISIAFLSLVAFSEFLLDEDKYLDQTIVTTTRLVVSFSETTDTVTETVILSTAETTGIVTTKTTSIIVTTPETVNVTTTTSATFGVVPYTDTFDTN